MKGRGGRSESKPEARHGGLITKREAVNYYFLKAFVS